MLERFDLLLRNLQTIIGLVVFLGWRLLDENLGAAQIVLRLDLLFFNFVQLVFENRVENSAYAYDVLVIECVLQ